MTDALFQLDKQIFWFCNNTLANGLFDMLMPILTDLNKTWYGLGLFLALLALLMIKGGRKGIIVGLLLIAVIAFSDQMSSSVIKKIIERPRPCWNRGGVPVVEHVRLIVTCGGGSSFPSTHAVNNFAVAALMSFYYRKWIWPLFLFAASVAFSRVYVGVHFPADVLGGALLGMLFAALIILFWQAIGNKYPVLRVEPE